MPRWTGWLVAAALIALRIAIVPVVLTRTWPYGSATAVRSDVGRYQDIAASRGTPYRDFELEQPPVTLAAIDALAGGSEHAATVRLMYSQLILDLAVTAILVWAWGRRAAFAYLLLGLPLVLYPFLYLRLDLLSVALAIGALALVHRRRNI